MTTRTPDQNLQAASYCVEAAQERADYAIAAAESGPNNLNNAVEQAALAAKQAAYAVERVIAALSGQPDN